MAKPISNDVLVDSEDTRGSDWASLAVACAAYVVSYYLAMQPGLPLDGVLPFSFWFAFLVLFSRRSALSRGRAWCTALAPPPPGGRVRAPARLVPLGFRRRGLGRAAARRRRARVPVDGRANALLLPRLLGGPLGLLRAVRPGAVWPRVVGAFMAAAALLFALFLLVEARREISEYIEFYYNTVRQHSKLGYVSPVEYERENEAMPLKDCPV